MTNKSSCGAPAGIATWWAIMILALVVLSLTGCGPKGTTTNIVRNEDGTCTLVVERHLPAQADRSDSYFVPCPAEVKP